MIKSSQPLTLTEVSDLAGDSEKATAIKAFIKRFDKTKVEKAKELKEKLEKLEIIKLKPTHITKIIDFMPQDAEDVHKILSDVSLDQDEINKILEAIK